MGAAFLITLREGLEIGIVLAILIAYLVKTGRRQQLRSVWLGTAVATVACLIAGVAVHAVTNELHGKAEPAVEGTLALFAAVVLTLMILWMRKNARSMGGHLRAQVDGAQTGTALAAVAFVGVAREGFETVLFLLGAESGGSSGAQVVVGGLLGLAVSAVLGVLVYLGGNRIDLRRFFRYTGVVLILFAAGLVGKAVHEFGELLGLDDLWLFRPLFTLTNGPLASGTLFDFLKGLFGWSASPERLRVVAYLAYAGIVLWLFLRPDRAAATPAAADHEAQSPNVAVPS